MYRYRYRYMSQIQGCGARREQMKKNLNTVDAWKLLVIVILLKFSKQFQLKIGAETQLVGADGGQSQQSLRKIFFTKSHRSLVKL